MYMPVSLQAFADAQNTSAEKQLNCNAEQQ